MEKMSCGKECEVFSRVVGYHRPVQNWNLGKKEEFRQRKTYDEEVCLNSEHGQLGKPSVLAGKIINY